MLISEYILIEKALINLLGITCTARLSELCIILGNSRAIYQSFTVIKSLKSSN